MDKLSGLKNEVGHISENNKLRRDNASLREALATGRQLIDFLLEQEESEKVMIILTAIKEGKAIAYNEICAACEVQALPFRPALAPVIALAPPSRVTGPTVFAYP